MLLTRPGQACYRDSMKSKTKGPIVTVFSPRLSQTGQPYMVVTEILPKSKRTRIERPGFQSAVFTKHNDPYARGLPSHSWEVVFRNVMSEPSGVWCCSRCHVYTHRPERHGNPQTRQECVMDQPFWYGPSFDTIKANADSQFLIK